MTEDIKYKITFNYNICDIRSWIEIEIMPDGSLRFVGMGKTEYGPNGHIVSHKVEPTGAVGYLQKSRIAALSASCSSMT